MLRKGMENIRLLRSDDPRIVDQMLSLSPYRPVSDQPAIRRDLSIAVPEDRTAEELGDRVREALGQRSELVESVEGLSETAYGDLPPAAIERLGISSGQKNTLLRVVLRDLRHTPSATRKPTRYATRSTPPSTKVRPGSGPPGPVSAPEVCRTS